jgi:enamine deaminase RidA (YjgF/YER057c/UK114 family)
VSVLFLGLGLIRFASAQATDPESRLKALGIALPDVPPKPVANYVGAVRVGNLLFVSGNAAIKPDGSFVLGKVGAELSAEDGYQAARLAAIAMLSNVRAQLGSLDKVKRVIKVTGYVNSAADFTGQPKVVDGYSDLLVQVFGEAGRGARLAVGSTTLGFNVSFIGDAILEVE